VAVILVFTTKLYLKLLMNSIKVSNVLEKEKSINNIPLNMNQEYKV
jgi:hypothetical protein